MSNWPGKHYNYEFIDSPIFFNVLGGGGGSPWNRQGAVFILSREERSGSGNYCPLLVEETDDLLEALNSSDYTGCPKDGGANHVHWKYERNRDKRRFIKQDILESIGDTPCNK